MSDWVVIFFLLPLCSILPGLKISSKLKKKNRLTRTFRTFGATRETQKRTACTYTHTYAFSVSLASHSYTNSTHTHIHRKANTNTDA